MSQVQNQQPTLAENLLHSLVIDGVCNVYPKSRVTIIKGWLNE